MLWGVCQPARRAKPRTETELRVQPKGAAQGTFSWAKQGCLATEQSGGGKSACGCEMASGRQVNGMKLQPKWGPTPRLATWKRARHCACPFKPDVVERATRRDASLGGRKEQRELRVSKLHLVAGTRRARCDTARSLAACLARVPCPTEHAARCNNEPHKNKRIYRHAIAIFIQI